MSSHQCLLGNDTWVLKREQLVKGTSKAGGQGSWKREVGGGLGREKDRVLGKGW